MIVAGVAIIVVALAVALKSSGGLAGVALTQVMSLSMMLTTIVMQWTVVETSIGSVSRIKNFVENTPSENKTNEVFEPPLAWPRAGKICLNSVSAFYETKPDSLILRTVSLSVEGGQKIGICGRSGSGKSSLLLLLSRMLEMKEGSIVIDGVDLSTVPRNTVRARLNIVPQEPVFIPGTVRFNLDPRHESSDSEVVEALRRVHLLDILEAKGGLLSQLDLGFLSHGQRQLFCLAVAILRKASIVLLDEVTSNVDRATDDLMQTIIRKQFRDCTVISIAHRLSTILDFDQVVVLDCGVKGVQG
ncbi:ABC transporter domain-containing protein [Hirsutella rhossiliensis]|uniref:ABC transporter domain-containing protein n=1 Tax=Hirsutella rhossiliensis TaxID=111463 RepID=A0A9P8SFL1_9HYPO|nr:ABC transporter domain-containing protein [Hirsutella rhossiliensis]KAH0959555.1 ABC transporter domain-containing protein [Hirsutella rhossiliensis]